MNRIPFRSVGLALAAALFAAGCSESTGPDGAPTDLTVRVYVDADGSGTFNAGDTPVPGATVTAAGQDGAAGATAQTDASGAATLTGLRPGSYTLALSGAAPAGAVLTSASAPLFTATSQGGAAETEFRFAYFPNTVTGTLYRDDNANNAFDATDTPAPGVTVQLFAGAATGTPVAETQTTGTGSFTFAGVRPGAYTLRVVAPQGVSIVDGADKSLNVPAQNPPVNVQIRFTGNLRVPIAQARLRPTNSTVTVEGVATAGRGQLAARNFYIQDATGGVQIFVPAASTAAVALGDSVRVTGIISPFAGEVQIAGTAITVEKLGTGTVPAARNINSADVVARTYEGQLVRLDSLEVVSIATTGGTTPTGANVTVRTPQGDQFQVRLDNLTNVPVSTFEVGRVYTVTGPLGINNANPQIKPRSTADVQRTSAPTVADAKAAAQGSTVTVTGVVTTTLGEFSVSTTAGTGNVYVQDRTGGIQVFGIPLTQALVPGDSVQVTGTLGAFNGEVQISTPLTATRLGTGTLPAPRVITGAQLASRAFEGELVRVNDLLITAVAAQANATASFNVTAQAPDGTTFTVRVEGRTNVERAAFTVGSTYDLVGIATAFVAGTTTSEQLKPRTTADVIAS